MEKYKYPEELKYSDQHTWVLDEERANVVIVGLTDYMQTKLGHIVVVELPEPGEEVDVGDDICVVEGEYMVMEVCAPLAGKLIAVNNDLPDAPGFINSDPYGDGWLYKLKLKDKREYNKLLDVYEYVDLIDEVEEE